jgi:hypothetical protein
MRIVFFATIVALAVSCFVPDAFAQNSTLGNVTKRDGPIILLILGSDEDFAKSIFPRPWFDHQILLHLRSVTIKVGDTISHRNKQIRHHRREIDIVLSFAILYAHFSSKTLHDLPMRNRLLNGHRKRKLPSHNLLA